MRDSLKYSWIVLCICCGFAVLMSLIPFAAWQKAYMKEYYRLKSEPQHRIDETYKYLEEVEQGATNVTPEEFYSKLLQESQVQIPNTEQVKPKQRTKKNVKTYKKPLFIRDKKDPKKLRPYRSFWWFNK